MRFQHSLLAALALCACSSGDEAFLFGTFDQPLAGNPSPVARSETILQDDDDGQTFRAYYSQILFEDSDTIERLSHGYATLRFRGDHLKIRTALGRVVEYQLDFESDGYRRYTADIGSVTERLEIFYSGTAGERSSVLRTTFGEGDPEEDDEFYRLNMTYGHRTSPERLPDGIATYNGSLGGPGGASNIYVFDADTNYFATSRGALDVEADFVNARVSGTLFDNRDRDDPGTLFPHDIIVSLRDGRIRGSEIFGETTVVMTDRDDPSLRTTASSGDAAGQFVGYSGDMPDSSVIGAFGGRIETTSNVAGDQDWQYSGEFIAYQGDEM